MTTRKTLLASMLLVLVGLMITGCSSTPLPPVFVMAAPTPLGGVQEAMEQPAAAQAVAMATEVATPSAEPSPTPVEPTATATSEPPATPTAEPSATQTSASQATATSAPATATATRAELAQAATATATPRRTADTATPTRIPTRAPARTVAPTATPTPEWPKTLIITEADIEQQAAANAVPGLQISGLNVDFGSDTMTVSFDSLRYSLVSLRNVTVEGHFTVSNCDVNFVADTIRPRNLATTSIPGFVNQALDQALGTWCVDSLRIGPGQMVVQVQPR